MWMPFQSCPGLDAWPMSMGLTTKLLPQQCELCRRPLSRVPWAPVKFIHVTCTYWIQWKAANKFLAWLLSTGNRPYYLTPSWEGDQDASGFDLGPMPTQVSWNSQTQVAPKGNATTLSSGGASCTKQCFQGGLRRHCFNLYYQVSTERLLWKAAMIRLAM